jgi:hypothetical protein
MHCLLDAAYLTARRGSCRSPKRPPPAEIGVARPRYRTFRRGKLASNDRILPPLPTKSTSFGLRIRAPRWIVRRAHLQGNNFQNLQNILNVFSGDMKAWILAVPLLTDAVRRIGRPHIKSQ